MSTNPESINRNRRIPIVRPRTLEEIQNGVPEEVVGYYDPTEGRELTPDEIEAKSNSSDDSRVLDAMIAEFRQYHEKRRQLLGLSPSPHDPALTYTYRGGARFYGGATASY